MIFLTKPYRIEVSFEPPTKEVLGEKQRKGGGFKVESKGNAEAEE